MIIETQYDSVRNRLNEYIFEKGVKYIFIARKCKICTARLSRFLHNKGNINENMLIMLEEFLKSNYK